MAGVYLHIPFCERKCIYCDFYSIENRNSMDEFVRALHREVAMNREYGNHESVDTIFFGGGTPSLLSPAAISGILEVLHRTFRVEPDAEITLEANPGTVDREKLLAYRSAGINRLSFGVQSFHQDELEFLGRIHSAVDAEQCIRWAQDIGFENISVDLVYALPRQTLRRWEDNLRRTVGLEVPHISAYSLIIEERTPLARMVSAKLVSPLPTENEAEMYELTMEYLARHGFEHYEVSNYSRPGHCSRHNSNYWNHSNYLGLGPSAHSFWKNRRWWNVASVSGYIEKISGGMQPLAGEEILQAEQLLHETVMLGLRSDGVNLRSMGEQFGPDLPGRMAEISRQLFDRRLAVREGDNLRLTDKGFLLCDEISEVLLSHLSTA
ncbi:MAG: radical SAM family heme chaperone HemW [Bacteroidota bacterium]|jgi:oxygen-independent coproporphyrinogen-3 oxidase